MGIFKFPYTPLCEPRLTEPAGGLCTPAWWLIVCGCILFDGENISFDASLVIYINNTNIPPIMIMNRIYEKR